MAIFLRRVVRNKVHGCRDTEHLIGDSRTISIINAIHPVLFEQRIRQLIFKCPKTIVGVHLSRNITRVTTQTKSHVLSFVEIIQVIISRIFPLG